jgi:hypothetical protein
MIPEMSPSMTPEAKNRLNAVIAGLRARLLTDFRNAAEGTYHLSIPFKKAKNGLSEENRVKRERLEKWLDEQTRRRNGKKKAGEEEIRERHYGEALKLAAATFLNRMVMIRHMEAVGLIRPAVVTGGRDGKAYREFREFAPALLGDETEGYGILLRLLFDELALDLPGLFGKVGITDLFPVPPVALWAVVEALNDRALETAWTDDTTLGWVYQFWNDPDRKALDEKIRNRRKIERHEIAAKTQLFTERYMVEWLLQNSLNNLWLAICEKNGWKANARADGTLEALETRRAEWRVRREAGEVAPEEIMPMETEAEERWKYWVEQELTPDFVQAAPTSLRELKLLDPAVGSGHFLVIAFSLLAAFYREEAEHRGETWPDREIAESIIENNLHGIDLDPRAVQIAAAALWLKAKTFCREAAPKTMNLVASNLGLATLPEDDPAVRELKYEVLKATGIPEELTGTILQALQGADYLGSLLKVDEAVEEAILEHERREKLANPQQGDLFGKPRPEQILLSFEEARVSILEKLDRFLEKCTSSQDLGLRLRGEQLAAGGRFLRLVKRGRYDGVVANPPYQGTSNLSENQYIQTHYPKSKADLYCAFLARGIELCRKSGCSAMVTMRGWMFIKQYEAFRAWALKKDLRLLGDLETGAFEMISGEVVSAVMSVFWNKRPSENPSIGLMVTPKENESTKHSIFLKKKSNLILADEKIEFATQNSFLIKAQPLIYWWDEEFLNEYKNTNKISDEAEIKQGLGTRNNIRFVRFVWEVAQSHVFQKNFPFVETHKKKKWVPFPMGGKERKWFEPLFEVVFWKNNGLQIATFSMSRYGRGADRYFSQGVLFSPIGTDFKARINCYAGVLSDAGPSVFSQKNEKILLLLNSSKTMEILQSLNPTVNFKIHDVERVPFFEIGNSDEIYCQIEKAFFDDESKREKSVEFKKPGSSSWKYAQKWAQKAVDRPENTPLPDYNPVYEDPPPTAHVSFAIGVALGRFGANGEGILDEALDTALPHGILYLSAHSEDDGLRHPACGPIHDAWEIHGPAIASRATLKKWLMEKFFADVHLDIYEKRPIYFPLSSKKKNFVAFAGIHRWTDSTLQTLLAEHLIPEQHRLDGEIQDLMDARQAGDQKSRTQAESRYANAKELHEELGQFIELVRQCAEQGPPPAKAADTPRETDARFRMDLDDGVMINSAALWPLLEPQWKQPKTWWSELCNAKGRKDYDWAHLAARYFPERVDEKCRKDPSLAVAHGCFWKYHPEKAYQWELRLQDEIGPDFTIDEENARELAAAFKAEHPEKARELEEAERKRRERKRAKANSGDAAPPPKDSRQLSLDSAIDAPDGDAP